MPLQAAAEPASPDGDGSSLAETVGVGVAASAGVGSALGDGLASGVRLDATVGSTDGAATEGEGVGFVANLLLPDAAHDEEGREDREEQPREGPTTGRTGRRRRARSRSRHGREGSTRADSPSSARSSTRMDVAGSSTRYGVGRERPREGHGVTDGPGMGDDQGGPATLAQRGPRRRDPHAQVGGRLAARPVDVRDTAGQCLGELRFERRQLVERAPFGDPEIGLAPALVDLHVVIPAGRREDLRGGTRAARRARDDQDVAWQRRGERRGERPGCRETGGVERRVAAPAVAASRPARRRVADEHDVVHAGVPGPVAPSSGPETAAESKVAMPSRSRMAASISPIARAAPVPSPSRRSRSSSGRRPSRSSTIA